MIRLLSSTHLRDLSKWQRCGCPDCLKRDGLEVIEVWNPQTEKYVRMLSKAPGLFEGVRGQDSPQPV